MLSLIRRLTRPSSVALLVLLLAPMAVDCCDAPDEHGSSAACCHKTDGPAATLTRDCCGVQQAPANGQTPARLAVRALLPLADVQPLRLIASTIAADPGFTTSTSETVSPPGDPLYLRLSAIRR